MAMSVRDIGADIRITLLACCATVPSQQLISALCDAVPLMMHVGMWRLEKKPIDARVGESSCLCIAVGRSALTEHVSNPSGLAIVVCSANKCRK